MSNISNLEFKQKEKQLLDLFAWDHVGLLQFECWSGCQRMIPPTLSTGTHATKFPRREVVVISVSGVYRHSVLKL